MQKLEQEQKNKMEGERGGEKRKRCFLLSPLPTLSFLFFALVSTYFVAKLARKRLLRRLFEVGWGALDTLTSSKRKMTEFQENYASGNLKSPIQPLAVFMLQTLKSSETLKVY